MKCACVKPLCPSDAQQSASPGTSLSHSPRTRHEVGREDPEEGDDPKTSVSSGAATPVRREPGTEMHSEGRKGTGLQDHGVEVTGA